MSDQSTNPRPLSFGRSAFRSIVAAAYLLAARSNAEVVSLLPSKDNTLFQSPNGEESSGAGESIFAGRTGPRNDSRIRRAVIAFDLTGVIPANATISEVRLTLFLESAGQNAPGTTVSLHALQASWGEGISAGIVGNPASASPGDATWLHRFHDTAFWSQPGGDFESTASDVATITGASEFYEWSGTGLLDDVRDWLVNPASNFGWILTGEEGDLTTALRFHSRESTVAEHRPQLTITYTVVPESTNLALLATGILLVSRRAMQRDRRSFARQ